MEFCQPISELVKGRYSCRSYSLDYLDNELRSKLVSFLQNNNYTPFKSKIRFMLASASKASSEELKELGTYGKIKNPAAFIIGAVENTSHALEDFGYSMEKALLYSMVLGLSTCWLGGSFKRGNFTRKISATRDEIVPATIAIGYENVEFKRKAKEKKNWDELFFNRSFHTPLSKEESGKYVYALEMVRLAPSAKNIQSCRILKEDNKFHFFLKPSVINQKLWKIIRKENLQKIDMGIAMCHFELAAHEIGINGKWEIEKTCTSDNNKYQYIATWIE